MSRSHVGIRINNKNIKYEKQIQVALCISVLLVSCKKSHITTQSSSIYGTWELRATKGGNILPSSFSSGNGHLLSFFNTSYTYTISGSVVTQGNYLEQNQSKDDFSFSSGDLKDDRAILQGDTLIIKPSNPDISSSYYVKNK